MLSQKLLLSAAGAAAADRVYVDDVFSTFLYEGNGSTGQTINNGIDLSGEGGMVWIKDRDASNDHAIYDTERGVQKLIKPSQDFAEHSTSTGTADLYQFNNNGFSIGYDNAAYLNTNGNDHVSWTFRKCPGFFDVVTYTGNGSNRTISHNLGSVPGSIWIKQRSGSNKWSVYHRGGISYVGDTTNPSNYELHLNETEATADESSVFNDTEPTSTVFTVGTSSGVNGSGQTYVAYIFAHDDQSFGTSGNEAIIKCGNYTGNGTTSNEINVGFEPQWLLIKTTSIYGHSWYIFDSMRGIVSDGNDASLLANSTNAEDTSFSPVELTPTGFKLTHGSTDAVNGSNRNYIYIAIRRPHKPPSAGTDVFAIDTRGSTGDGKEPTYRAPFPVDMQWNRNVAYAGGDTSISARLTQGRQMHINLTGAESANSVMMFDYMNGVQTDTGTGSDQYAWMFKRAPSFFDVVTYSGHQYKRPSENRSDVPHSLGVVPEMIWIKPRSFSGTNSKWLCYHKDVGNTDFLFLDSASTTGTNYFGNEDPTSSVFTLFAGGLTQVDSSAGESYIAYLFASLDGISKVGSYTGTGSDQNIDCGFTNGARFVLIRRTDTGDSWHAFDTTQGINSGAESYYRLDLAAAQVTGNDFIDPLNTGFKLVTDDGGINASGATYIFLAIA